MTRRTRYSQEVRERAIRMVFEHEGNHASALGDDQLDRIEDRLLAGGASQVGAKG